MSIFHLAAAVGVKLIVQEPVHTIETNVHGTEVILRHAAKKKKLVFIASTSEVYGKSTQVPFREDADLVMGATTRHRWAYACSKALDEFLALAYWQAEKAAGDRGPLLQHRRAAADRTIRHGGADLRPPGAGRRADHGVRRRHAVAQLHLCRRRRRALLKLMVEPRAIGQVFNIGNTEEVTIAGSPRGSRRRPAAAPRS